jgi:NAD(P)-dependent dehydrogenase (short-subunit alcohol dehydrogenase family)
MARHVLITGAHGGLGPAVVEAFEADGWTVSAPARAAFDLETEDGARGAVAAAGELLSAVVHLVGGFAMGQPIATTAVDAFDAMVRRHLRSAYLIAQASFDALKANDGVLVLTSAQSASKPFAGAAGYIAAKAGVAALAGVVAAEGVRCTAITPGVIDTPANRADGMTGGTPPAEIAAEILALCR